MLVERPSISSPSFSSSGGGEASKARGPSGTAAGMTWVSMLRVGAGDGAADDAMMRLREPELRLKTGVSAAMVEEGEEEG
jgi:hypothetical protein